MKKTSASKIERAKLIRAAQGVDPKIADELKKALLSDGSVLEEELERAIAGLREEDEFAVLCRTMGTATMLVDLGQRPIVRSEVIVPDFLIRFEAGYRFRGIPRSPENTCTCLVEVKSTDKTEFKLSGSQLKKRRAFATQLGLPLLFAVRFKTFASSAVWAIVYDSDPTNDSLKVTANDLIEGVGKVVWDDFGLMFVPGTVMVRIYDAALQGGFRHREYGSLVGLRVVTPETDYTFDEDRAGLLTAFTDTMDLQEERVETRGAVTQQVLRPPMISLFSTMMYRFNFLVSDGQGGTLFDSTRVVSNSDTEEYDWLIKRETGEMLCRELAKFGLASYVGLGDEDCHVAQWESLFRTRSALTGL